jgi:6-pyruvoyltetrahydropterin/6-carboxytetrahydropterin synthase
MKAAHTVSRRIEIDTAHRVPDHGGKCRNLHGHRYLVEAVCAGELAAAGHERGMVIDFAFLKEEMVGVIHDNCDHAIVLWSGDPLLGALTDEVGESHTAPAAGSRVASPFGPILILPFTPTAENLARYWFEQLKPRIAARTGDRAELIEVRVWETPNTCATYSGPG